MTSYRVLISDKLSPDAKAIFEKNGITADVKIGLTASELAEIIHEYDGLAIRSATKVTADIIAKASKLKVVGRAGIGVDNVDIPAATKNGIVVMNTPFGNSITTAEHAIAMMFATARKIPQANVSTHQGLWEKSKFMGVELYNKTLGLIGCGNIGSIVAERAIGLKMNVVASDPFLLPEKAQELGIKKVELEELLATADFITLHTPLNDKTRNILNEESLSKTKKGVRIINCARGGLIDEAALKKLIESNHIAAAALDVFAEEPAKNNPLFGTEQVICTPHLGASTAEAQENVAVQVAEQISDYLINGTVTNALNLASVTKEESAKLKPYIRLASKLGVLAGSLAEQSIQEIAIDFEGQAAGLNIKPLVSVALQNILKQFIAGVNMVNAKEIAKERGIKVREVKHQSDGDYLNAINIRIATSGGIDYAVKGSVFAKDKPRLVEIANIKLEAELQGSMLFIENEDKPGLIGGIGRVLGEAGINIGNFHLGRGEKGGGENSGAIALIAIDSEVPNNVMASMLELPSAKQVKQVKF